MNFSKLRYLFVLFAGLLLLSIQQWSCSREYSYEGADTTIITDTTIINDSTPVSEPIIYCPLCHEEDSLTERSWSFRNGDSYFCGSATYAGFLQNTGFTFFGRSACSIDSGLVITAYIEEPFDEDKFNITTNNVAFYYYDHNSSSDMFIKLSPLPFSLTVNSYIQATGVATGTFGGIVYKSNGDTTHITSGRFKIKLH